jgi:DNA-binding protein Fis
MKQRSLQGLAKQLDRAAETAVQQNAKLLELVEELAGELRFRSSVAGILEQYRQDLQTGKTRRSLKEVLDTVESFFVTQAMKEVDDNIAHAAELLQIPEATLRYKLGKHGLR